MPAGIGKIYLYDHNSTIPLSTAISSYVQEGFVEHIPFQGLCRKLDHSCSQAPVDSLPLSFIMSCSCCCHHPQRSTPSGEQTRALQTTCPSSLPPSRAKLTGCVRASSSPVMSPAMCKCSPPSSPPSVDSPGGVSLLSGRLSAEACLLAPPPRTQCPAACHVYSTCLFYTHLHVRSSAHLAAQDCVERFSSRHAFMGFIDVDEFVMLYDTSITHIDDLLKRSAWWWQEGGLPLGCQGPQARGLV